MIQNGLLDRTSGDFFPIHCRAELKTRDIQFLLQRNHLRPGGMVCGCGIVSVKPPLVRSVWLKAAGMFTVAWEDIGAHESDCFMRRESDFLPVVHLRLASILAPVRADAAPENRERDGDSEWHSRTAPENFSGYARRVLSRGLTLAYLRANSGKAAHVNVSAIESLTGVDRAVEELSFGAVGRQNGYQVAREHGWHLRFGLIYDPVMSDKRPVLSLPIFWWRSDGFELSQVGIEPSAMAAAIESLNILGNYRKPPYWIFAVQGATGSIHRLFLHQVCVREEFFVPVDSGAEAHYAEEIAQKKIPIIKPIRNDDIEDLLQKSGINLESPLPYRPDFLVVWKDRGKTTLAIRELRGFAPGSRPEYDHYMEYRQRVVREMRANVPIHYREVSGVGRVWRNEDYDPNQWNGVRVTLA